MINRSTQQVMESWPEGAGCAVSVICTTFNHEQYIEEALDGFLSQETNFPFEIIVHDDASTDQTQSIIRDYAIAYPAIVRPVIQSENRYKKGGFKPVIHAASFARGEYLAICEGDDYWLDKNKLALQYEALLAQPEIDFCMHPAFRRTGDTCKVPEQWNYGAVDRVLPLDMHKSLRGLFAPTPSYMLKKSVFESLPCWVIPEAPVGDVFMELYGMQRGGALYLSKPMAVYRVATQASWTAKVKDDPDKFIVHKEKMLECIDLLKQDFPGHELAIASAGAAISLEIAQHCLRFGRYTKFRENIERSHSYDKGYSLQQAFFYRLRKHRHIALALEKTLRFLSRNSWRSRS